MRKVIRLTEDDLRRIVNRVIKEQEQTQEVADKVEMVLEKPSVQNKIDNMLTRLSEDQIEEIKDTLDELGIDENTSAEEVVSMVNDDAVSDDLDMDSELSEEDEKENMKHKVAKVLNAIGAGNIATWGGVPTAIAIGAFTGFPMGVAISIGVSALLCGLAKAIAPEKDKPEF